MLRLAVIAVLVACAPAGAAHAAVCQDFTFPEKLTDRNDTLVLNGVGLRRAYRFVKVYVAGLYLPAKTSNPAEIIDPTKPHTMVLHMLRSVTKQEMVEAWTKGFQDNAPQEWPTIAPRVDALQKAIPAMNKGDEIWFSHKPGEGVTFTLAGKASGRMEGDDFARALFSIYVGPKPPNEGLKTGVLGGACD
jgi:hypothetical protein